MEMLRYAGMAVALALAAGVVAWFSPSNLVEFFALLAMYLGYVRAGVAGAFRLGAHHGAYCLGCCWALMGVLFVVGVMNLLWVALLGAIVLLEKIGPGGPHVSRAGGVAMLLAGIAVAVFGS